MKIAINQKNKYFCQTNIDIVHQMHLLNILKMNIEICSSIFI